MAQREFELTTEELAAPGGLESCLDEFVATIAAWRERSDLHG